MEPQLSDIINIMNLMDIHLFRFDLSSFLDQAYTMSVYFDEYRDNIKVNRIRTIKLGKNIHSLDEVAEKHRKAYRLDKQIPEGENEWDNIKEFAVYVRKTNDTTSVLTIDFLV